MREYKGLILDRRLQIHSIDKWNGLTLIRTIIIKKKVRRLGKVFKLSLREDNPIPKYGMGK